MVSYHNFIWIEFLFVTDWEHYQKAYQNFISWRNIRTTNGIECFFGSYKNLTDHEILTIDVCLNSLILRYKLLITKSLPIFNQRKLNKFLIYNVSTTTSNKYRNIIKR